MSPLSGREGLCLTSGEPPAGYPAWSPLGDQIVYEHGLGRGNVWIVSLP